MSREKSREEIKRKGQRKLLDVIIIGFHFEIGAIAFLCDRPLIAE